LNFKTLKVLANEMWGKGKHEPVPLVSRAVMQHQFVQTSVSQFVDRRFKGHESFAIVAQSE
jgi:hypothetical protein